MTRRHRLLNDALQALDSSGPLAISTLARQINVVEHDAHIVMLTAEVERLVYATAAGEWAITDRGRYTLQNFREATRPKPWA
jgi:hypothetical protein